MVFDKVYLIKSISAVTNYNSSSCFFFETFPKSNVSRMATRRLKFTTKLSKLPAGK